MDMALPIEMLVDTWRAAEGAKHGQRQHILKDAARKLGLSVQTLYRELEQAGLSKARKQRADAGVVTLSREEALILSAFLMASFRANNKKLLGIENALEVLRTNGEIVAGRVDEATGEFMPLSASACSRALREYGLHPDQLNRATPSQNQRSLYPNHVWQIDASISTLFYVPESGLEDMHPAVFYKNKPGNFEKIKRQRLTRYAITDHASGAIFCWYVAGGESIANLGESFLEAVREKPGEALYGVPFKLYYDPGSAATKTFKRFLAAMGVSPVVHGVGNSRATGQVENAHNIIETQFEVGFKYSHVPNIAWINEKARKWCKWFNATKKHSRTKRTRLAVWMTIAQEQLRLANVDVARELLTREPETAKVTDQVQIRFKGRVWDVSPVPGVMIGETLSVTVNPLKPESAFVVFYQDGEEVLHEIQSVEFNELGFEANAPVIDEEFKQPADTQLDKNRKEVQRYIYNAETDEQAELALKNKQVPFGGRIDPYKHLDNLPQAAVLPRRGTAHEATQSSRMAERVLSHAEAALQLKKELTDWSAKDYAEMARLYPAGVPETELSSLAKRLRLHVASIQVLGGGSC